MQRRLLWSVLRWLAALALVGGLLVLAYALRGMLGDRRGPEAESAGTQETKSTANNVVKLGAELAESLGLKEDAAQEINWQPRVVAYGRVVPNPRAIVEVRAAFAGTLRAAAPEPAAPKTARSGAASAVRSPLPPPPSSFWPALGSRVEAGDLLGWLDIRVGPQERLDLEIKLREARAKLQGAEEVLRVQQERFQRFQTLEGPGAVSRAELDQAFVQLAEARTQQATAKEAVQQWQDALAEINGPGDRKAGTWSQPLKAPASGEITDLPGRPGMALEAGGLIARIVDFRRALVRLDIPVRALGEGPPPEVELFALGEGSPALEGASNRPEPGPWAPPVAAKLAGAVPQVDAMSQYGSYWYELDTAPPAARPGGREAASPAPSALRTPVLAGGIWRPGLFVKALIQAPGIKPRLATAIPETALLYHQGRTLVYVRLAPGRFERREVQVLGREAGRWILASGVSPGELVVSRRAQVLLSEEFRSAADND